MDTPTVQVSLRKDGDYTPENPIAEKLAGIAKNGEGQLTAEDMMEVRAMGFAVEVVEQMPVPAFIGRQYKVYMRGKTRVAMPVHVRDEV